MLKITMLQTPGITMNGVPVSFPFKRAEALIYYMLVQRSATRQELVALFWENQNESTGLKNLRNTLYSIKKSLGDDFLISPQKSQIAVNNDWQIECDYYRFTRQHDFSSYSGPFLNGFSLKHSFTFEEWVTRTREKLHEIFLAHLEQQARDAHNAGNREQAIQLAKEYLREEPFDEAMAGFLMQRLQEDRKYSKAAEVYQKLKDQLSNELGAAPQASTTALYYEIMNQWNTTQISDGTSILKIPVGRESAYNALCSSVGSFINGSSHQCSQLLIGEVGSGKSELADYFLKHNDLSSLLVLQCTCHHTEECISLAAWNRVMISLWEFLLEEDVPVPPYLQARLGQTFSCFLSDGDGNSDAVPAPRQLDSSLQDSILLLFSAVVRRRKILLFLEDIQWADDDSVQIASAVLRSMRARDFMAVFTCRDNLNKKTKDNLDSLLKAELVRSQRIHPLTKNETEQFLAQELDSESARLLAARFYEETSGNLYLLTELTHAYRRNGDINATLQSLEDILMNRLSSLSDNAVRIAQIISLFQADVPSHLLLELTDRDDCRLAAGLEELCNRGIIEEHPCSHDMSYCFIHKKIQELIYNRLPSDFRRHLHQRAAGLLSESKFLSTGNQYRQIARHFQLSGDPVQALQYRIQALDMDTSRACTPFSLFGGDHPLYISTDKFENDVQKCRNQIISLHHEGRTSPTLTELDRWVTLIQGRIELFQGNISRGTAQLGELSDNHSSCPDISIRACYLLACTCIFRQEYEQAEHYTSAGARLIERRQNAAWQSQFQRLRGSCFCLRGEYDKGKYYLQEAINTLRQQPSSIGIRLQLAAAYADFAQVLGQFNDYAEACSYYKRAVSLLEDGPWTGSVWIFVHYGRAAFFLEDHVKAREMFLQAYQNSKTTGELWGRTAATSYTAYYYLLDGDYAKTARFLSEAQDTQSRFNSPLENTILNFICMKIRRHLELDQSLDTPLAQLVPNSAEDYARQGIRLPAFVPGVFEVEYMSKNLRDGITSKVRYRAGDLYSKNKHYMAE